MPNGSHGGGEISRDELLRVLDSVPDDRVVGQLVIAQVGDGRPPLEDGKDVAALDVRHLVQTHDQKWFLFEKIDHPPAGSSLVIHLCSYGPGPGALKNMLQAGRLRWLYVTEDRAVFRDLERLWADVLGRSKPEE